MNNLAKLKLKFSLKSQIYFSFSLIKKDKYVKNLSKDKNFVLHLDYLIGEKNYLLPLIGTDFIFAHYNNDLNEYFKCFENWQKIYLKIFLLKVSSVKNYSS